MALGLSHISQAIRCTFPKCSCECFSSTKSQIRTCHNCKHGWVAHAVDKLISTSSPFGGIRNQMEPISPSIVFDIASLVLYGCHAIPIRLKMSLDRLFSALQHDEVLQILHGFGWSYEDYARGYILQDGNGRVLEKYGIITREEENVVLQQFVRFAETRNLSQELLIQDTKSLQENSNTPQLNQTKSESDIRKFIERNNMALMQNYNLALRRAFDNPQSILSAMGSGFPPHLNPLAAAATAAQFSRAFPSTSGMIPMPTAGYPQIADPKVEPIIASEQSHRRTSAEPYDLTKRSPESHSKSCSPSSSVSAVGVTNSNSTSFPKLAEWHGAKEEMNANDISVSNMMKSGSPPPVTMRRSASPPPSKQTWPFNNPAFGQTVYVTTSGKKRVLCTACNKTFCDKGALKIHYSAVHLKEMHKCTIPGCNMMFSSRRSRNRHSANPNPKLHTPQTRRPRERYDPEQDRMLAMMGMRQGPKLENDCDSLVGDGELIDMSAHEKTQDSTQASDEEHHDAGFVENDDSELVEELPTQVKVKQDGSLYRNNKRKRLMPTKVPTSSSQASVDDDIGSVKRLKEENTTIENDTETEKPPNEVSREPGEVRSSRSPVEPGEVVRPENGEENAAKFMSKFPMTNTDKVSVMQSLLSSFLPPTADNQNNAFWSSFIQKTAAAAAAQNATLSQELNVEDNSDDESTCSEKADDSDKQQQLYKCTIDGCQSSFSTEKNRNLHSMNLKLHRAVLESNASMIDCDTGNQSQRDCIFCDKSFPSGEILAKHIHAVHQGQEPMYNDQNFSTQIDSLKNKTPVIA